jgi:hypothetical protein
MMLICHFKSTLVYNFPLSQLSSISEPEANWAGSLVSFLLTLLPPIFLAVDLGPFRVLGKQTDGREDRSNLSDMTVIWGLCFYTWQTTTPPKPALHRVLGDTAPSWWMSCPQLSCLAMFFLVDPWRMFTPSTLSPIPSAHLFSSHLTPPCIPPCFQDDPVCSFLRVSSCLGCLKDQPSSPPHSRKHETVNSKWLPNVLLPTRLSETDTRPLSAMRGTTQHSHTSS